LPTALIVRKLVRQISVPERLTNLEKVRIATELEYTTAKYGSTDERGMVNSNSKTQSNLRLLVAFYHFF
jgi:hypothetical protein